MTDSTYLKKIAAATIFALAAIATTLPSQNVYAGPSDSDPVKKCISGAVQEIKEQIKKIDEVGGALLAIDLATTGGQGTVLYGGVSSVWGCLKGAQRQEDSFDHSFWKYMEFRNGEWVASRRN